MLFSEYINRKNLTYKKVADALGLPYEYIRRYAIGEIIPNKENMAKIFKFTKGKVTANDFYGVKK